MDLRTNKPNVSILRYYGNNRSSGLRTSRNTNKLVFLQSAIFIQLSTSRDADAQFNVTSEWLHSLFRIPKWPYRRLNTPQRAIVLHAEKSTDHIVVEDSINCYTDYINGYTYHTYYWIQLHNPSLMKTHATNRPTYSWTDLTQLWTGHTTCWTYRIEFCAGHTECSTYRIRVCIGHTYSMLELVLLMLIVLFIYLN